MNNLTRTSPLNSRQHSDPRTSRKQLRAKSWKSTDLFSGNSFFLFSTANFVLCTCETKHPGDSLNLSIGAFGLKCTSIRWLTCNQISQETFQFRSCCSRHDCSLWIHNFMRDVLKKCRGSKDFPVGKKKKQNLRFTSNYKARIGMVSG